MKIHTGDVVVVISGKDKGKQGKILRVLPAINRVVVEGVNMRIKHIKKTAQQPGQRVSYEASLSASNVMILDPKTKKPTRIGYTVDQKTGKKTRIAKVSGEEIKGAAVTKAQKAPAKGAKTEEKAAPKAETPKAPAKQPFWKRGSKKNGSGDGSVGESNVNESKAMPSAHRSQGG